jgi:hypothetical protein
MDVTDQEITQALQNVADALRIRLTIKGRKCYISLHEVDGVLDQEIRQFKNEVQKNDRNVARLKLVDAAISCIFGIASLSTQERVEKQEAGRSINHPG